MQHEHVDEIRKQRDTLLSRNHILEQAHTQQQEEIASLKALNTASIAEQRAMQLRHEKAAETFARTIETMMARTPVSLEDANSGAASLSRKRSRPLASEDDIAAEAAERERQAGIDRYVEGVLQLRDAAHARAVEELKQAHKAETDKLRAKAREPVNEFRESKRFHIREAELKAEVEKAKRALEAEKERAKSMEFEQVDRMDDKRQIRDLKHRCADRDLLAQEVERLKEDKERRNEPYRDMTNEELLGMIDVLKEKHAMVVIGMVDGVDAMKKERDAAVGELKKVAREAKQYKECLEGRFGIESADGGSSSSSKKPKAKPLCSPCARVHTAKLEALSAKHKAEVEQLQQSVKRLTAKLDAKLEAHVLAHRFRDREDELRKRNEALEQELAKAVRELREKRANFDTHMASTLRHKAIAKELASVKEQYEAAKTRLAEVERSVMQQSLPADLAARHHTQMLRAKRVYSISRERALQLAARLDAEQLRTRAAAVFEEELLFAYRSLRAEYNRDVGRAPETRRPRRGGGEEMGGSGGGGGDWLDGVSEGEPGV